MSKRRRSRFTKSSRVSEKVMEYYLKYGKDRELEKFMRFRSPAGSQKSNTSTTTTTSSVTSSEEWARMGSLGPLFHETKINSEERTVMASHKISLTSSASSSSSKDQKEHFVPIQVEESCSNQVNVPQSPKTPVRRKELCTETKQTQTPESAAKTHKRLEWDSLGDVGYKKSKSTSNISIVERMLLREFFEVTSNAPKTTNSSESDIRLLEQEIADLGTLRKHFTRPVAPMEESKYGTPPLASSTRVEAGERSNNSKDKKIPKLQNVATNTSMQKKFEKYVQTSLKSPKMTSQEVQVTLTPPGISPLLGSSAEPSSFEYRSHYSTNSSDPKSTRLPTKQAGRPTAGETYPYACEINEMLADQRNFLAENDNVTISEACERLKQMFRCWNKMMGEDKENTSTSSSCSTAEPNSPQVDLGIQLIYGIMKAKNIEQKQKKRLVRNIVKRITKVASSCELDVIVSRTATLIDSNTDSCREMNAASKVQAKTKEGVREQVVSSSVSVDAGGPTKNTDQKNGTSSRVQGTTLSTKTADLSKAVFRKSSTICSSTSIDESNTDTHHLTKSTVSTSSKAESRTNKHTEKPASSYTLQKPQEITVFSNAKTVKSHSSSAPAASTYSNPYSKTVSQNDSLNVPKANTSTSSSSSSSSCSENSKEQPKMLEISLCIVKGVCEEKEVFKQPHVEDSSTTTTTSRPSTSQTSSSSKDLSTQKSAMRATRKQPSNTANDKDETMQEWLNPMTQSEVEYEDKKRKSGSNKNERKKVNSVKSEKNTQLNWIDCEIERLQQLKHILINDETSTSTESENRSQQQNISATTQASEKLYDTVYSDRSQSRSQTISPPYRKLGSVGGSNDKSPESRCSQFKSILKPQKTGEQVTEGSGKQPTTNPQRSKIDTPTNTNGNESVGSFVRQRKQEFLDHYKSQKLSHYDHLMHRYDERPSTSAAIAASSGRSDIGGHYSVPVAIQFQQPASYYTYPPMQQTYRDPCYYTQTLAPATTAAKRTSSNVPTKTSQASSSELSVPMGSYNTSSTETTTHQYDVAAPTITSKPNANTGSQTGQSLLRSRPIYQTRCASPYQVCTMMPCANYIACTYTDVARSACIQARPKGIAYSLQFTSKSVRSKPDGGESESSTDKDEEYTTLDKAAAPSLQVALERGKPEFLTQAKQRKSVLNRIQKLRQEREHVLREIADDNTSINSLDRKLDHLPPPVTEQLRLFPTKQMKALTNKKVSKLPEVLANKEKERLERRKKSNRLLRDVFNRRLRERVRGGKLTLNHSLQLI